MDQIVNAISGMVESGKLAENERLLSINEFSKLHRVVRDTIEKAYTRMKAHGYVAAIFGKGHFISVKKHDKIRVLFIFNKLSSYKQLIYNSFRQAVGNQAKVDIFVDHYSPALPKECLSLTLGNYDYEFI